MDSQQEAIIQPPDEALCQKKKVFFMDLRTSFYLFWTV